MMIAEHSIVVLRRDIPETSLRAADVGAVVHVHRQGVEFEVEFIVGDGAKISLMTLSASDVRPIVHGELLHTRRHTLAD